MRQRKGRSSKCSSNRSSSNLPDSLLTPRELVEIVRTVASGRRNRIARERAIAEATVKTRLCHIYQRLGVWASRAGSP